MIDLLEGNGLETVVERGDRAFPYSHRASDVVDTLVQMVLKDGVMLLSDREVKDVLKFDGGFSVKKARTQRNPNFSFSHCSCP